MEKFRDSIPLTRRKFLELIGASAAVSLVPGSTWASLDSPPENSERGEDPILTDKKPRIYSSEKHTDARMHLGGIGTGHFEMGVDGQLTAWQLFNTYRDGQIPFYFAVKAGNSAKVLQIAGGPQWPRVQHIEMQGNYPIATLHFKDADLPVDIKLEAFNPFAPLDAAFSSMPLVVFRFLVRNPTDRAQKVSLAAMLANPVGYAAIGDMRSGVHPSLGWNVNEVFRDGKAAGLHLSARHGEAPSMDGPVVIYLLKNVFAIEPDSGVGNTNYAYAVPWAYAIPPLDRPKNLKMEVIDEKFSANSISNPDHSVIWLEEAPIEFSTALLTQIKAAVESGATLVFSGKSMPLLSAFAAASQGKRFGDAELRPAITFEDFEGNYDKWTAVGDAFGIGPAHGGFSNQQPISGFAGKGFVNSYLNGDDSTGKLTSRDFVIERNFIRLLVGGGRRSTTQVRLIINGQTMRAATGQDSEHLRPVVWDVKEFAGRSAHLEIVDDAKGGWGHILVDEIVFTDWPTDPETAALVDELLPVRFSAIQEAKSRSGELQAVSFVNPSLNPDSQRVTAPFGLAQFTRSIGKGKVILYAGQLLDPALTHSSAARQTAYSALCSSVSVDYKMTRGQSSAEPGFGDLALAVLSGKVTALASFENWDEAWKQFEGEGRFEKLPSLPPSSPTPAGKTTNGALAAEVLIPPGETVEIPFMFAWHYPNRYGQAGEWIGNHYATQWKDARAVMQDAVANYEKLKQGTAQFCETFYDATLPGWLTEGLMANAATVRNAGVVFQIANGDIYGWEGSNASCEPTCTHVWGYEQALARLFPGLEKEMRRIDFMHQQNADGGINNRTDIPSPPHPTGEHPFTDGQASCILKAYREALNSADDSFFKKYWPRVKRAMDYLVRRDAAKSGGKASGILQDDQWNTYDEALHGVTTFISGYYLAALRASESWALRVGDASTAEVYKNIFQLGQKRLIDLCWNGEYFHQNLADYKNRSGEVGPGCMADQLIGQWWAHQMGLGYILPQPMVVSALKSIFKYNWKPDLTGWKHWPRAFAGAGDKGLIVCTWPKAGRPENVMLYSDEVWTGIEYQVAAHMIYEGLIEEGLSIAKGARDRYDGIPRPPIGRNPWCEIECGGHYARAMSSWSLLLALSGFYYDGPARLLRFNPHYNPHDFKCFFSAAEGWGTLAQNVDEAGQKVEIAVTSGSLRLQNLELTNALHQNPSQVHVKLSGAETSATLSFNPPTSGIRFKGDGVVIEKGQKLEIVLS